MTPPQRLRCPACGRGDLRRAQFRKRQYRLGESPYAAVCQDCQDADDEHLYADSPLARAEREVEREYGIPAERWRNSPDSPLVVLAYALAVQYAQASRRRLGLLRAGPGWTLEDAQRLCAMRGLVPRHDAA